MCPGCDGNNYAQVWGIVWECFDCDYQGLEEEFDSRVAKREQRRKKPKDQEEEW